MGLVLILPLYEYLSESGPTSRHQRRIGIRVTVLIALGLLSIYIGMRMIYIALPFANVFSIDWLSFEVLRKIIGAYGLYLNLILFPYPHQPFITTLPVSSLHSILFSIELILLLGGFLFALFSRQVLLGIGLAWTFFFLTPPALIAVMNVAATPAAERYAYVPSIGLLITVAWLLLITFERLLSMPDLPQRKIWISGGVFLWVTLMTVWGWESWSWNRNAVWRSPLSFWETATAALPGNAPKGAIAHLNLGLEYQEQGRLNEAIRGYQMALKLKPDYAEAHNNLGNVFVRQRRLEDAVKEYQSASKLAPGYSLAHYNLGDIYKDQGHLEDAVKEYEMALKLKPDLAEAHNNLGVVYGKLGHLKEAVQEYQTALRLQPDDPKTHNNLGTAYKDLDRIMEAIREFQTAISLNLNYINAHYNLALAYTNQSRFEEAIEEYQAVIRLKPDDVEARYNLGVIYARLGKFAEAKKQYQQALQLKPDFLSAQKALDSLPK